MHTDLEACDPGARLQSRFCVVGAGVGGLVLARQLSRAGYEVSVLEAGGLEMEERSQELYQVESADTPHAGSTDGRFRTFGGSSTRWGGQMLPYTDDVFTPLPGIPSTAWPITTREVSRFYRDVELLMDVGDLPFTEALLPKLRYKALPISDNVCLRFSKWAPFARRNLAHTIGAECIADPRIHVFTHANVRELCGAEGRITYARVSDYKGRIFEFAADYFVVAAGTVESSRILLSSEVVPNADDQLGRYFHDHVSFHAAVVPRCVRGQVMKRLGPFFVKGVLHTCKIEASTALRQDHGLSAAMAHFVVQEPEDSGIAAVRHLLQAVQQRKIKKAINENLGSLVMGLRDVGYLVWASKVLKRRVVSRAGVVRLNIDLEQESNAANRIRLSEKRDALGLRRAVVDWRINEAEYRTAAEFVHVIKREFEGLGFGPFEWTTGLLEGARPAMSDTYHPMGGLRMGTQAMNSVVDADLKVHDLANLYVASCAVYPSGGSSNPTFTLMALSLRLGEHLAKRAGVAA